MDVYHKVLLKLYQTTGGKDSQTVDLKDLVKNLGFLGNYNDISQMLSGQGWIVETPKLNYVRITHWGVSEIKKIENTEPDSTQIVRKATVNLIADAKQLVISLEEFISDTSKENLRQIDRKLNDVNEAINKLRANIN